MNNVDMDNDNHEKKENDQCVYETIVSDDDNDGVDNKILISISSSGSSPSETENIFEIDRASYAYFGTDPDKMIESDQQLFLDDIPDTKNTVSKAPTMTVTACNGYNHRDSDNDSLIEYACNVKDVDEDESFMASFLTDALLLNHEDDGTMFDIS